MTQYNTLHVKFFIAQINKLKSGITNGNEITLKISSNIVGDSNDENYFPHKLSLTNKHVANNSSVNMKSSKTQLHKIGQSGEFLGRLSGPLLKTESLLLKTESLLVKNVLKPLTKSLLIPIGLIKSSSISNGCSCS